MTLPPTPFRQLAVAIVALSVTTSVAAQDAGAADTPPLALVPDDVPAPSSSSPSPSAAESASDRMPDATKRRLADSDAGKRRLADSDAPERRLADSDAAKRRLADSDAAVPVVPPPPKVIDKESIARAKALYDAGANAYQRGQYAIAIDAFESSVALVSRASTQFSLAQSCRLQFFVDSTPNLLDCAVANYRAYLTQAPAGARRDHAAEHLATIVPMLDRLRIESAQPATEKKARARLIVTSSTPGALAFVGSGVPQRVPAAFEVDPSMVSLSVTADGYQSQVRAFKATAGALAINIDLEAKPGRLAFTSGPLTTRYVDGRVVTRDTIALTPGLHRVLAVGHGRESATEDVLIVSGETTPVDLVTPVTAQTWIAIGFASVGAILATSSLVPFVGMWVNEAEAGAIEAQLASRPLTVDEAGRYQTLEVNRDNFAGAGAALALVGAVVTAVGVALFAFDFSSLPASAPAKATPAKSDTNGAQTPASEGSE